MFQSSGESSVEGGEFGRRSINKIVQDIATAVQNDRGTAIALSSAAQAFDHHDVQCHDDTVNAGAVRSLISALNHTLRKMEGLCNVLGDVSSNEAQTVTIAAAAGISALEMILTRCSDECFDHHLSQNRLDLLLSLGDLLNVFATVDNRSTIVRQTLLKSTARTILRVSSFIDTSTSYDIFSTEAETKAFCSQLIRAIQSELPLPACADCLAVLANFATHAQHRHALINVSGLLDALILCAQSERSERCVVEAYRALFQLSQSEGTARIMNYNEELLCILLNKFITNPHPSLASYAIQTTKNMLCRDRCQNAVNNRTLSQLIIDALVVGLQAGDVPAIESYCLDILNHLLTTNNNFVTNRSDLMLIISSLSLEGDQASTNATTALSSFSRSFEFEQGQISSRNILSLLIKHSKQKIPQHTRIKASEVLCRLSESPTNATFMTSYCEEIEILSSLVSLTLSGIDVLCSNALSTIYNLCKGSRHIICRDCNVVRLLIGIASQQIVVCDEAYVLCMQALITLVQNVSNRKRLSKSRYIVPAFVAFAASSRCRQTKDLAIDAIVLLSQTAVLL